MKTNKLETVLTLDLLFQLLFRSELMMDSLNVKADVESILFPAEFHSDVWETIKLIFYVMCVYVILMRRDRIAQIAMLRLVQALRLALGMGLLLHNSRLNSDCLNLTFHCIYEELLTFYEKQKQR